MFSKSFISSIKVISFLFLIQQTLLYSLPLPAPPSIHNQQVQPTKSSKSSGCRFSNHNVIKKINENKAATLTKNRRRLSSAEEDESNESDDGYEYEAEEESHATTSPKDSDSSSSSSGKGSLSEKSKEAKKTIETRASSSSRDESNPKTTIRMLKPDNDDESESNSNDESQTQEDDTESENENESDNTSTSGTTTIRTTKRVDEESSISMKLTSDNRHERTNLKHLSKMILKIVTTNKIKSMVDIPCRNSVEFMPSLLNQIDFEMPGFKYYCVDTEKDVHEDIFGLYSDAGNPEFIHLKPETASLMPKTDLVFSWDGPQDWGVTNSWSFLMHLRQLRPNYILITNNPGEANGEKDGVLNLRKQPFHFNPANRVINNVWNGVSPKKQLLFYDIKSVRRGF